MTVGILVLIIILSVFIIFPICFFLLTYGITLCNRNNAWGIIFLLISLNLLGLLIGWIILFNNNHNKLNFKYKWIFTVKD